MKTVLLILTSALFASYAFGSLVTNFVTAYASQSIEAQRVVVEEGSSTRIRYERVVRSGMNEFIDVMAPVYFEWVFLNGKSYIVDNGEMKLSPAPLVDIEQRFVELLSASPTVISTSDFIYQGEPSYEIKALSQSATYIAVIGKNPMILKYLKVEKKNGSISVMYTSITFVPKNYFNTLIANFRIESATPEAIEIAAWKLVSSLKNATIASMNINGIAFTVIAGMFSPSSNVIAYLFNISSDISPDSLVNQFKMQGYSSTAIKFENINIVFASQAKIEDLKAWIVKIFNK